MTALLDEGADEGAAEGSRDRARLSLKHQIILGLLILCVGGLVRKYRVEHPGIDPRAAASTTSVDEAAAERADPIPNKLLVARQARFSYGLVSPRLSDAPSEDALGVQLGAELTGVTIASSAKGLDERPGDRIAISREEIDLARWSQSEPVTSSRHLGGGRASMVGTGAAYAIAFDWSGARAAERMAPALAALSKLAQSMGAWVIDGSTGEVYSAAAFEDEVAAPARAGRYEVLSAIAIVRTVGAMGGARLSTRGLAKLGLPELVVEHVPLEREKETRRLLVWIGATLAERRFSRGQAGELLDADGRLALAVDGLHPGVTERYVRGDAAPSPLAVQLHVATRREGDPERLARIDFDGTAIDALERARAALGATFDRRADGTK